jgi:hypothetical protein
MSDPQSGTNSPPQSLLDTSSNSSNGSHSDAMNASRSLLPMVLDDGNHLSSNPVLKRPFEDASEGLSSSAATAAVAGSSSAAEMQPKRVRREA